GPSGVGDEPAGSGRLGGGRVPAGACRPVPDGQVRVDHRVDRRGHGVPPSWPARHPAGPTRPRPDPGRRFPSAMMLARGAGADRGEDRHRRSPVPHTAERCPAHRDVLEGNPMRIVIMAVGGRGDVAPLTGLGVRLREAGHDVALAVEESFAELVRGVGLEYRHLPGDTRAALASRSGQEWQRAGTRLSPRAIRATLAVTREVLRALGSGVVAAAEGADVLLLQRAASVYGYVTAQAMGIPCVSLDLWPSVPTAEFAPLGVGRPTLGRWLNRNLTRLLAPALSLSMNGPLNDLQRRLGVPVRSAAAVRFAMWDDVRHPILCGYSPVVAPRPADWRPGIEVVGYWWPATPVGWTPPAELVDFLDAGEPPVFVGFGSMGGGRAAAGLAAAGEGHPRDAQLHLPVVRGRRQALPRGARRRVRRHAAAGDTPLRVGVRLPDHHRWGAVARMPASTTSTMRSASARLNGRSPRFTTKCTGPVTIAPSREWSPGGSSPRSTASATRRRTAAPRSSKTRATARRTTGLSRAAWVACSTARTVGLARLSAMATRKSTRSRRRSPVSPIETRSSMYRSRASTTSSSRSGQLR